MPHDVLQLNATRRTVLEFHLSTHLRMSARIYSWGCVTVRPRAGEESGDVSGQIWKRSQQRRLLPSDLQHAAWDNQVKATYIWSKRETDLQHAAWEAEMEAVVEREQRVETVKESDWGPIHLE